MAPADLEVAERLAKATNRTISGVLREGLKRLASEQYWREVHAFARPKAEVLGIAEEDVTPLISEYRQERSTSRPRKRRR